MKKNSPKSPPSDDDEALSSELITHSEKASSERLGISLEAVSMIRKNSLIVGDDYTREGLQVRIHESGLKKMAAILGEKRVPSSLGGRDRIATLIVEKANLPNARILLAKEPGSDVVVRVRVRDSHNWMRGMAIEKCRQVNGTLFHYEGRQPRYRGKM